MAGPEQKQTNNNMTISAKLVNQYGAMAILWMMMVVVMCFVLKMVKMTQKLKLEIMMCNMQFCWSMKACIEKGFSACIHCHIFYQLQLHHLLACLLCALYELF